MKILPPVSIEARRLLPSRWDLLAAVLVLGFIVLFADARSVTAHFQLAGIKPGESVPVTCELRRAGKVMAHATAQAARGAQRFEIGLEPGALAPGAYELTARAADGQPTPPAALRVIESPWRK